MKIKGYIWLYVSLFCLLWSCKTQRQALKNQENGDGIITYQIKEEQSKIPDETVKIRINFVLLNNDDGLGGFNIDNPEHMDLLNSAVIWMNASLAANGEIKNPDCFNNRTCYPKRTAEDYIHIPNAKIEFVVNEVLTYDATKFWDNQDCQDGEDDPSNKECPDDGKKYRCPNDEYSGNWYLNPLSQEINRDPNILPAIDIFFTEDGDEFEEYVLNGSCENPSGKFHTQDCSERPSASLDKEQRVHMRSAFLKYSYIMNCSVCETTGPECINVGTPNECCIREKILNNLKDGMSRTLMHELGHSVEFTSGHCNVCPREGLMHASRPGKYLHNNEIEYAHEKIRNSNLRKYIISDEPIFMNGDHQTWSNFLNLHKHYVLVNKTKLEMQNETHVLPNKQLVVDESNLTIASEGRLILEENAKLVVKDGATLTILEGGTIQMKPNSRVIIQCGANVEYATNNFILNRGGLGVIEMPCKQIGG